jgi:hypothetical protein
MKIICNANMKTMVHLAITPMIQIWWRHDSQFCKLCIHIWNSTCFNKKLGVINGVHIKDQQQRLGSIKSQIYCIQNLHKHEIYQGGERGLTSAYLQLTPATTGVSCDCDTRCYGLPHTPLVALCIFCLSHVISAAAHPVPLFRFRSLSNPQML